MKNGLLYTIERFWKYHFILRTGIQEVQVWQEKISGSFDTGLRLSMNYFYELPNKNLYRIVEELEDRRK